MAEILIIDNDQKTIEILNVNLKGSGYSLNFVSTGKEGLHALEKQIPDLVICHLNLSDYSGLDILDEIKKINQQIQVLIISDKHDVSSIIKAMQKGAFDFLIKPLDIDQLKLKIERALEIQLMSLRLNEYLDYDAKEYNTEHNLIGITQQMRLITKNIGQLSSNKVSVFIHGESGTGKELIAKIIHFSGKYKEHPFVAINCSALSENLLESELFGHVKGAFTGAIKDKKGKFELAREGTIFLDEISELSYNLQSKLLRVLQEREFEKVGGESTIPMNARILAASNQNLEELVNEGKFRQDLYFRLKVFTLEIPPLRERKEDIPLLVTHFLRKINADIHKNVIKIPIEVMDFLKSHNWPGNVRELENTLLQAVVLSKNDVLFLENIKLQSINFDKCNDLNISLEELEKRHIQRVLDNLNWNKAKATEV
ncbi:MAG: sigma-54 dependent transcriptional regulator, partial [Melioribacteraceae bacterium]